MYHSESYWEEKFQLIKNEARKEYKTVLRLDLLQKQEKIIKNASDDAIARLVSDHSEHLSKFDAISVTSSNFLSIVTPEEWLELQGQIKEKFLSSYQSEIFCSLCNKGGVPEYKKKDSGVHHSTHVTYGFEGYCHPQNLTKCLTCGKFFCQEHLYNGRCAVCNKPEVIEIHHYY